MISVISEVDNGTIVDFKKEIQKIDLDANCIRNGSNLYPLKPLMVKFCKT